MKFSKKLEAFRIRSGYYKSGKGELRGAFHIPGPCGEELVVIASNGEGEVPWEHVSVSLRGRTPNWLEMCFIKDLFWGEEEAVVQLHPPKSVYVNNHPNCLHLWRPLEVSIPLPPKGLV